MKEELLQRGFPKGFLNRFNYSEVMEHISTENKSALETWVSDMDKKPWLYLHGEIGEWKTALAVKLGERIAEQKWQFKMTGNYDIYYFGCSVLFDWLRDFKSDIFDMAKWDKVLKSGLLILDDLGTEFDTLFSFTKLQQIINYRYENSPLLTIITSNYSLADLVDRMDDYAVKQNQKTRIDEIAEYELMAHRILRRIKNQSVELEF